LRTTTYPEKDKRYFIHIQKTLFHIFALVAMY